jgi:hypothetical protein
MERAPLISIVLLALVPISITAQENQQPSETRTESVPSYKEATSRTESTAGFRTLQKIGLAFHGYHDIFGRFPPAVLYGPDGKTPYSWRVELLPVLKHYAYQIDSQTDISTRQAYDAAIAACGYDTLQPWDSPHNLKVLRTMPEAYRHPSDKEGSTHAGFSAITGTGTVFDPATTSKYIDITGWPRLTLMVAEYQAREPWTKPVDIAYSHNALVCRFGGFSQHGFLALSADGAVHFVTDRVMPNDLRAFISTDQSDVFTIPGIPHRYR